MQLLTLLALTTAASAVLINTRCGNNYGQELCADGGASDQYHYVAVCNDQHVWAVRQTCGHRFCCKDKAGGGAYCAC
ncbi:hypothetical protein ISF_08081 [Cordyceps fumosorosea ARSEF 2679]|uniref:Uncharacterized protein n=1 Tax=Cordyceps fumosorosea (strain ARSEF 2679) TaxID=1081104 RepID=A0A162MES9_CORFA|nr:hypothetical protein ISF_08081 [Cordyceps fumosorosea ARSEF 2679]OAA55160.1 hypothetical protein ISF_08081 [Cordyceps fumosorosea ARSEF 2679]